MKKILIVLAVFIILVILVLFSLEWHDYRIRVNNAKQDFKTAITHLSSQEKKDNILSKISDLMELKFPPSSQVLFACVFKTDSPFYCCMKLEISKDDLEIFVEEIQQHRKNEKYEVITGDNQMWYSPSQFSYYNPEDVWQADNVINRNLYTIIYGSKVLHILIDLDNPDEPIIYFISGGIRAKPKPTMALFCA